MFPVGANCPLLCTYFTSATTILERSRCIFGKTFRHVPFANLPNAPVERFKLRDPTVEERAQGQTDFVPQFIPTKTLSPEPRLVQSQRYSALFQEIADLRSARPNATNEEQNNNNTRDTEKRIQVFDSNI